MIDGNSKPNPIQHRLFLMHVESMGSPLANLQYPETWNLAWR